MSADAQAGMAYAEIAASAYRAFSVARLYQPDGATAFPAWETLSGATRIAWEAAVRHAEWCFHSPDARDPAMQHAHEVRWAGWQPPGSNQENRV